MFSQNLECQPYSQILFTVSFFEGSKATSEGVNSCYYAPHPKTGLSGLEVDPMPDKKSRSQAIYESDAPLPFIPMVHPTEGQKGSLERTEKCTNLPLIVFQG